MSDVVPEGSIRSGQPAPPSRPSRVLGILVILLAAATFLVGLVIGYTVWGGARDAGRDGGGAGAAETAPPEADAGRREQIVTVPQECLIAVDESEAVLDLVEQAVAAAANLDAARLQQIVDELQGPTERVRALGEECRARADVSSGPTSPTATD